MRRASQHCEPVVIDGVVFGVNLGFDFCAEHEWGFKWAARYLGRPDRPTRELLGVKARTTTRHDDDFVIEVADYGGSLWLRGHHPWRRAPDGSFLGELQSSKDRPHYLDEMARWGAEKPLRASWSGDGGFCVAASTDEAKRALRQAHEALIGDRCFIVQGGSVFGAGGLKLMDAALVPPEIDAELRAADVSKLNLDDAVEATGIRERLTAAGRRYYALSPRWDDEGAGTFKFWLNPMDQRNNNYGWFSLADLEAWIDGKGPIPMTAAQRKKASR